MDAMKLLMQLFVLAGLLLHISSAKKDPNLFQVVTSHPHDLEELSPHIETVHQSGRLWVVRLKENSPASVAKHLSPLRGSERSYFYQNTTLVQMRAMKKKTISRELIEKVDRTLIEKDVVKLASDYENRAAGTDDNLRAVRDVAQRFRDMNYKVSQICYTTDICSIVAEKVGTKNPKKILLVEGHIDSVGESFAGADDNASGVAVILEMARIIKDVPTQKTVRFFIANGEEDGLLGSEHYAKALQKTKQIKNIELVINMDMVGYNFNNVVELETEPEFEALAKWYAGLATNYTILKPKITLGAWGSDHVSFLKRGIPSILTMVDWETKSPCYHEACDTPDSLNYEFTAEIAKLNLSAILTKDIDQ